MSSVGREDGVALVVAIIIAAIVLALLATGVAETIDSRTHASRDTRVKRALQAADAGIQAGVYQANQISLGNTDFNGGLSGIVNTLNCISNVNASGQLTVGVGNPTSVTFNGSTGTCIPHTCVLSCPANPPPLPNTCFQPYTAIGESSGFSYCAVYGTTLNGTSVALQPRIISVGFDRNGASDIVRRVEAVLSPLDPFETVESTGNLTWNASLVNVTTVNGDVRTDGNWTENHPALGLTTAVNGASLFGSSGSVIRGAHFQYGPSGTLTRDPASILPNPTRLASSFSRQSISIASTKPDCANSSGAAVTCANSLFSCTSCYNANDTFSLSAGQSASFPSGDYVFCSFSVASTSNVNFPSSGGPVRIFVDSPQSSRCSGVSGAGNFSASTTINGVSNSSLLDPRNVQIYAAGNCDSNGQNCTTPTTTVTLNAGSLSVGALNQSFFLYAPNSNVTVTFPAATSTFEGSIIGHDVTLNTSVATVITQDLRLNTMPLAANLGVFNVQQYIECQPEVPGATDLPYKDC